MLQSSSGRKWKKCETLVFIAMHYQEYTSLEVKKHKVYTNSMFLFLVYWKVMASTRSVHTVRKVTVVTSTSLHSTRRPHRDHCHPGQLYHAHYTLLIGQYGARIITLALSISGSLSEHRLTQWLQTLQFCSIQNCGREYSRISASSENQLMGQ